MGELTRESAPSSFAVVDTDVELLVEREPVGLTISLDVAPGVISEEPGYSIVLVDREARALRDWLVKVLPDG